MPIRYYPSSKVKTGKKTDGSELFGGKTGDFNPYANTVTAKCRWYQLGCWIKEIFGDEGGQHIIDEIVKYLLNLIFS